MTPGPDILESACADAGGPAPAARPGGLPERYFRIFDEQDRRRHSDVLGRLCPGQPAEALLERKRDGSVECTVLAYDYPAEFSLITGLLAASGFDIASGDVFTGNWQQEPQEDEPGRGLFQPAAGKGAAARRWIIDHFAGQLDTSLAFETWSKEFRAALLGLVGLLERGGENSLREARQRVNEMVVRRLSRLPAFPGGLLYPVEIEVDNRAGPYTRLRVVAEDTPAFLYALSNALSLHRVSIEHVRIRTIRGRVEDEIDLLGFDGGRIEDETLLNRVKLSVLLTKQFTYFLGEAPDPYTALSRFEHLVGDLLGQSSGEDWLGRLTDPRTLRDLARILGASDYLWEDFIRLQYETLLPMLQSYLKERRLAEPSESFSERLRAALGEEARSPAEQRRRLNEFKDRELFRIDLDQLLKPEDFQSFAARLTHLAEAVVGRTVALVYRELARRHGRPRTVAGLEARYAVMGLGKLGGAELGYASDLELLFVYSDSGRTDGSRALDNAEFFDRLVKGVAGWIKAKREGIFHVDLRLRPYGSSGPLASSLEGFCRYYGPAGPALAYERLALVRLRAVAGDPELGRRLERLRDEMVYAAGAVNLEELQALRERQVREKVAGDRPNAKFSPGGLVDIEYSIQMLQVTHAKALPRLRTPLLQEALRILQEGGVLGTQEGARLEAAYRFLRRLINGLRMLRGSARDLELPAPGSVELRHLARRMGYRGGEALDPAERLRIDFERHSAAVRVFIDRRFGRASLADFGTGTVADVVLSEGMPRSLALPVLEGAGFRNPERAYTNLRLLAGSGLRRETFAKLALLALDILERQPDPDMALNNWERFNRSLGSPDFYYNLFFSQPMRLEILLGLFAGSQFLSDTLVRNPGFLDWLVDPELLHRPRDPEALLRELRQAAGESGTQREWQNKLRRLRRREMLRIGTRDLCLGVSVQEVTRELSLLADAVLQAVLERRLAELSEAVAAGGAAPDPAQRFCILALGKLGGSELNYSSDIDLLGLWEDRAGEPQPGPVKALCQRLMERVRFDLSEHIEEGYAYRVDLRLRPFGRAGELVPSLSGLIRYYEKTAALWEIQAALKMRPVAGNLHLGHRLLEGIRPVISRKHRLAEVVRGIERMRDAAQGAASAAKTVDVKAGSGGLRDIEFLVQGLQLIHARQNPELLAGNTLQALELLEAARIVPASAAAFLKQDYVFLRRVEHGLQILEDRQVHALPSDRFELDALAKRVMGSGSGGEEFAEELDGRLKRVRRLYLSWTEGSPGFAVTRT